MINPQATGWVDDRTVGGRIHTRDLVGGLVPYQIHEGTYFTTTNNAAVSYLNSLDNPDGSGAYIVVSVQANAAPASSGGSLNFVSMRFKLRGTALGVRVLLNNGYSLSTANQPFTMLVDAVPYKVDPTGLNMIDSQNVFAPSSSAGYHELGRIVVTDLPDITHDVELEFVNHDVSNSGLNPVWILYGFMVPRAAGYTELPRMGSIYTPASVPNVTAGTLPQSSTGMFRPRGLRKVQYYNSTTSAITVTLSWNSTNFYALSVPANGSVDWDPGRAIGGWTSALKHLASSTGLTATIIGDL